MPWSSATSRSRQADLIVSDYVPPREGRSRLSMGCLPVGAFGLLVLVLIAAAALRSCSADGRVIVPRRGPNLELHACMKERGWVGTIEADRLRFDLGDRDEEAFESALQECDELISG